MAIVVCLALVASAGVWALGQGHSKPAALAPLSGTLPTIPAELPTTAPPLPLAAVPGAPPTTAPPPPAAPGFTSRSIGGLTVDVPADCAPLSSSSVVGSLGPRITVHLFCATANPRRIVLVASLNIPGAQLDGSEEQRLEVGRGVAAALAGRDAEIATEDHQVFGKPGVLVTIKLTQNGLPVYESAALGNGPNGPAMVIVGQANEPWADGLRVIDSAH